MRDAYATRRTSTTFVHLCTGTWKGAGCQYRPRALGLRRGAAAVGDELKSTVGLRRVVAVVVSGSSIVDNVFVVFLCFPIRRCSSQ